MRKQITTRAENFSDWYHEVVMHGDMAEPAEIVKGCMVIKPNGYAVWEALQSALDQKLKASGHRNVYFPMLIPEHLLRKETEHVEGFSPELAVVTIAGGKELAEPYIVRPTSEAIVGHFYSKWINSYRDLPLLLNQWANVVRWELRTRMFIRSSEFLWQEGHTAHATHGEALEEVLSILEIYRWLSEEIMAVPVISGIKTKSEKFAGAVQSYSIEAMMQNGFALQAGTSHDLGQNFAKAFNVMFQNKSGEQEYAWQTSWGVSTRLIGALIMVHSDDKGLVLPPRVAPDKGVLIPIFRKPEERAAVMEAVERIGKKWGIPVDGREGLTPGAKFFHWERLGVPTTLELGPRELADQTIVMKRRDTGEKTTLPFQGGQKQWEDTLECMQTEMYQRALRNREENIVVVDSFRELEQALEGVTAEGGGGKFVMAYLKDDSQVDQALKKLSATVRNIPLVDHYGGPGRCLITGEMVQKRCVVARAY